MVLGIAGAVTPSSRERNQVRSWAKPVIASPLIFLAAAPPVEGQAANGTHLDPGVNLDAISGMERKLSYSCFAVYSCPAFVK
jgi:hypothetical protein